MTQMPEFDDVREAETPEDLETEQLIDSEVDELAETSQDEYPRTEPDAAEGTSIDDLLETDRVIEEGRDSRNADGYHFDEVRERGLEDDAAADQGNRLEDEMQSEGDLVDEAGELTEEGLDEIIEGNDLGSSQG